jgi:hypothetical protein
LISRAAASRAVDFDPVWEDGVPDPKITYFPVGNGDCSLIELSDKTQILIDCNITEDSRDHDEPARYDVHAHFVKFGKRLNGRIPHVDAFILTHSDQDHCRGFDTTFYTGDPASYSDRHLNSGLILIDELWFTRRIFAPHEGRLSLPALAFRREARRRIDLHKKRAATGNLPGNRIRIIGYSDNPDYRGLEHLVTVPGNFIDVIDAKKKADFRFFVHAPFKLETDSKWSERNDTSVVLQARFKIGDVENACLALFGGDAGAAIWSKILQRSNKATLRWDLFLAPHHCSWSFFSELPYKDNKVPADESLEMLKMGVGQSRVICSCKPIRDDDDNPPHHPAKLLYVKQVGADRFHVTSETPNQKSPQPLVFEMSASGPVRVESASASAIVSSAAIQQVVKTPQTYG